METLQTMVLVSSRVSSELVDLQKGETPPDFSRALQLLVRLYWSRREDGIVVGLSERDEELLRSADVPIIIRNPRIDQAALREALPQAYCTEATGSAGWVEAIVGHAEA